MLTDDVGENEFGRWGGDVNGKRQEVIVSGARLESDVLEIRLAFASGILKDVGYDKEFLTKWFSYAAVKTLYLLTPVAADHKHKLYLEAFEKAKGGEKVKVSELPSDVLLNPVDEFISLENNTDFKYPISVYRK